MEWTVRWESKRSVARRCLVQMQNGVDVVGQQDQSKQKLTPVDEYIDIAAEEGLAKSLLLLDVENRAKNLPPMVELVAKNANTYELHVFANRSFVSTRRSVLSRWPQQRFSCRIGLGARKLGSASRAPMQASALSDSKRQTEKLFLEAMGDIKSTGKAKFPMNLGLILNAMFALSGGTFVARKSPFKSGKSLVLAMESAGHIEIVKSKGKGNKKQTEMKIKNFTSVQESKTSLYISPPLNKPQPELQTQLCAALDEGDSTWCASYWWTIVSIQQYLVLTIRHGPQYFLLQGVAT